MKTLGDIQNELSYNDYESDWNELSLVEQWSLSDEVAKRYALEYGQALLQKVADADFTLPNHYRFRFDKNEREVILNTKLDLI